MTVDERKMTIAYADLLNIRELVQHILQIDADDLLKPDAKAAFASIAHNVDAVMADVMDYMSRHTDFNDEHESKKEIEV